MRRYQAEAGLFSFIGKETETFNDRALGAPSGQPGRHSRGHESAPQSGTPFSHFGVRQEDEESSESP